MFVCLSKKGEDDTQHISKVRNMNDIYYYILLTTVVLTVLTRDFVSRYYSSHFVEVFLVDVVLIEYPFVCILIYILVLIVFI
jgi:hypothetical protein